LCDNDLLESDLKGQNKECAKNLNFLHLHPSLQRNN
jgi:hypothetical protein